MDTGGLKLALELPCVRGSSVCRVGRRDGTGDLKYAACTAPFAEYDRLHP
jgi:hypothetical protein